MGVSSCFTHVAGGRLRILSGFLRLVQTFDRVTRGEGQISLSQRDKSFWGSEPPRYCSIILHGYAA
jgi:hypothetical protein